MSYKKRWITPPAGQQYLPYFTDAERLYDLPAGLLSRIAYQESRYKPDAVSPAGAIGLMQIVPRWHPDADPTDPIASIYYAASYLRQLYDQFGNWPDALGAYNWGPGNVGKAISEYGYDWESHAPTETQNYIAQIGKDTGIV